MSKKRYAVSTRQNIEISRKVAREGMVLLENNGILPLRKGTRVAVFGTGQMDYIKTGSGSGTVNSEYSVNLITGLRNNGKIEVDEELAAIYEAHYASCKNKTLTKTQAFMGVPASIPEMKLSKSILARAAAKTGTAIITFNRNSGEGQDRTLTKGDYYLSDAEVGMFAAVRTHFDKVIAVLNICGVMDMSWVETYKIDAVLLAWLAGMEGGNVMAEILTGDVNPSGKLVDTFGNDYWDYPSSYNFGSFVEGFETVTADGSEIDYWGMIPVHKAHTAGTSYIRPVNNRYFINYAEGIYTGYRYFETFDIKVKYPFGYGLSYTTFDITTGPIDVTGDKISVTVKIKNTGLVPGKETVQVYYSAPDGKLEKPSRALAAYLKTDLIGPGKQQKIKISFGTSHMASYDEATAAYVLEPGSYDIYVGNSIKNVKKAGTCKIDSPIITERLSNHAGLAEGKKLRLLSKFNRKATFPVSPKMRGEPEPFQPSPITPSDNMPEIKVSREVKIKLKDVYDGKATMADFIAQMTDMELAGLITGSGMGSDKSIFGPLSSYVPGAAGHTASLIHLGIPTMALADGPAGIRIEKPCTAFPMGTLVACTWNEELIEEMGAAIGREAAATGVDFWLAPGMNIHRNPLCGRNFEYYSEDPLISGTMAAAVSRGVQSSGIGVTCKHFAANNQETNRNGIDTVVTERTLREIYLKGFEIAIKSGAPRAIMTSYNLINGTYTAARKDLNVDILRKEWGFGGLVMTDWEGDGTHSVEALRAGHNLLMPGFVKQTEYIHGKMQDGTLLRVDVERYAEGLINAMMKTKSFARYCGISDIIYSTYKSPPRWFIVEKQNG